MKVYWEIWAMALGEKSVDCNEESAEKVLIIRTIIKVIELFTCMIIVSSIIHHW